MYLFKEIIIFFFGFTLVFSGIAEAQNSISGSVYDAKTGKSLAGTNIFLNGTTIGTYTNRYGHYSIKNIPNGTYALIFSFVGYKSIRKQVVLENNKKNEVNVTLQPTTLQLKNVIVKGDNSKWRRNLKRFKKFFLGYTQNAKKTNILNPEVLEFKNDHGVFMAYAKKPLLLKNNALGYKIKVFLNRFSYINTNSTFSGYSKFKPITPKNFKQKQYWASQRKRAYNGSFRDFINALKTRQLQNEGFHIKLTNAHNYLSKGISGHTDQAVHDLGKIISLSNFDRLKLSFQHYRYLRVSYDQESPEKRIAHKFNYALSPPQISYISLPNGKAVIDLRSAMEVPPFMAQLSGYWGLTSHFPDLLPNNYNPAGQ